MTTTERIHSIRSFPMNANHLEEDVFKKLIAKDDELIQTLNENEIYIVHCDDMGVMLKYPAAAAYGKMKGIPSCITNCISYAFANHDCNAVEFLAIDDLPYKPDLPIYQGENINVLSDENPETNAIKIKTKDGVLTAKLMTDEYKGITVKFTPKESSNRDGIMLVIGQNNDEKLRAYVWSDADGRQNYETCDTTINFKY